MDNERRKMLRDLNNLQDQEEQSCSYTFYDPKKSSKESMGNMSFGKVERNDQMKAKLTKKKVTKENISDFWPTLCQPQRLYCCCKACEIKEIKYRMKCINCKKSCLLCKTCEDNYKDYEEPPLKSYIRMNSLPNGIIDMDKRRGSTEMVNSFMAIIINAIGGGRKASLGKHVVWIDVYESCEANAKDFVITLSDQKTAEKMKILAEKTGGIIHYANVDIPFEVKLFNMHENETKEEDVDNNMLYHDDKEQKIDPFWVPENLDLDELNELFNEGIVLDKHDGMEDEHSSSGVESSDSENDYKESSGDNDERDFSNGDDSSKEDGEDEEMEEGESVNGEDNDENGNELNVSEEDLWPITTYDEETNETKENSTVVLMGSVTIAPQRMILNDIVVLENGTYNEMDISSGDYEPQAKKARYSA